MVSFQSIIDFLVRQSILQDLNAVYGPTVQNPSLIVFPIIAGNSSSLIGSAVGLSLYHAKWISLAPFLEIQMFFDLLKSRCGILPPTEQCHFAQSKGFEVTKQALKLHKAVWRCLVQQFFQTGGVILCISWIWRAVSEAIENKKVGVKEFIEHIEMEFSSKASDMIKNRLVEIQIQFDKLSILYLTSFPVDATDLVSGTNRTVQDLEADGLIWTVTSEDNLYKNIIIPEVLLSFHVSKKCQALEIVSEHFSSIISSSLTIPIDKLVVQQTLFKVFRWSNALQEPASFLNFSPQQLGLRFEKEIAFLLFFRILAPIGNKSHNAKTLREIFPECLNMGSLGNLIIPPNLYFAKSQYVGKSPDKEWLTNGGILVNSPGAEYGDVILFGFEKEKSVEIALDAKCIRNHSPKTIFEEYQRCIVPNGNAQAVISIRPFCHQDKQKLQTKLTPYWRDYQLKNLKSSEFFKDSNFKHWEARGFVCTGRSLLGEMAFNWLQNDLENSKNLALTLDSLECGDLSLVKFNALNYCGWRQQK
jgi:hypothetical protein